MFTQTEEFPIQQLFSKDLAIQLKILNILYRNPYGSSIEDLVKGTNLYRKTVYKYLQQINHLAEKHLMKKVIESTDKYTYFFTGNKIEFLTLRYSLLETCTSLQLFNLLLTASSVNVYQFCIDNFISESTLKKNIQIINNFFSYLDIQLRIRKNEIYLTGDEAKIRYSFISFFWRVYNGLGWPFEKIEKKKIDTIIAFIFSGNAKKISFGKRELFGYFLAVNIARASYGHHVSTYSLPEYTISLISNSNFFKNLSQKLSNVFPLNRVEILFILMNFFIFPEYHVISKHLSYTLNALKIYAPDSHKSIIDYLLFIKNKHPTWNIETKEGQEFLAAIIAGRINVDIYKEAYFNVQDINLIEYASKNFPMLLPSISSAIRNNHTNLSNGILKSLIFKYSQAYLLAFPPYEFEPEIKILVITDTPLCIEKWLIYRVRSLLNSIYNVVITTNIGDKTSSDLIIATGFYKGMDSTIPIVYVFPQISQRDSKEILEKCAEVLQQKKYLFKCS